MSTPRAERPAPLRIAVVGAESTGKSVLVQALETALAHEFGLRCARVDEYLRTWCDERGRTPLAHEQMALAEEHARLIAAAGARADIDIVLCDTTPLMVSVYSDLLFDDRSLDPLARACQATMDATLLTSLDLPWVADAQRDGPYVRPPVDALVRTRLDDWGTAWSLVVGTGAARTANALDALRPLLRARARTVPAGGLFSRLQDSLQGPPRPAWRCERCDDPRCERQGHRAT